MHFFELMSFLFITSNEQFNESGTTVKCVKKDPLLLLYNLKKITLSCACQNTPNLNVFQVKILNLSRSTQQILRGCGVKSKQAGEQSL